MPGLSPDFVAVGHVTLDRVGDRVRPGGAALYAAVTAHRLGLSAGLLTSHGDDFPLDLVPPAIEVVSVPAARTTVFEHRREDGRRRMRVEGTAAPLSARDVPPDWAEAGTVLLAPVIDEVDPLVADVFSDAAVGAAAQGWLRGLGPGGQVVPRAWEDPRAVLARVQAVFLSLEDLGGDPAPAVEWFQHVPVGVLTAGQEGAALFVNGERYAVPAAPAVEVDATGAGDVFAAAFLVYYAREGDPWRAAAAAACAAACAVEGEGWAAVPGSITVEARRADFERSR